MPATMKSLGIDRMSIDDRKLLAEEILASIAAEAGPLTQSEAQRRELERRLADHAADPDDVVPWERIKAEALARFGK